MFEKADDGWKVVVAVTRSWVPTIFEMITCRGGGTLDTEGLLVHSSQLVPQDREPLSNLYYFHPKHCWPHPEEMIKLEKTAIESSFLPSIPAECEVFGLFCDL